MSPSVILDLPPCLTRSILCEWSDLTSIVALDNACCSRNTRDQFLSIAYTDHTVYSLRYFPINKYVKNYTGLLLWTVERSVRVDGFHFTDALLLDCKILAKFLSISGPSISWINFRLIEYIRRPKLVTARKTMSKFCFSVVKISWAKCAGRDDFLKAVVQRFPKLLSLDIDSTPPGALGGLLSLKRLSIVNSEYPRALVIPIEAARPSLEFFDGTGNIVSDSLLAAFGQHSPNLHTMRGYSKDEDHPITDVGVHALLQGCPLLKVTDVHCFYKVSVALRDELARRQNYTCLNLREWWVMSADLAARLLQVSPALRKLDAASSGSCWITDAVLIASRRYCPQLQEVHLGEFYLTSQGIQALTSPGNQLRSLKLTLYNYAWMHIIAGNCPLLHTLCIFENCFGSEADAGVHAILQGCPLLQTTDVEEACHLRREVRVEVAQRCDLTELRLHKWSNIDDELAQSILKVCPSLTYLNCHGCKWLTDNTLTICAQYCPKLERIDLCGCLAVTLTGLRALCFPGNSLQGVQLSYLMGDEEVTFIAEHCPHITMLYAPAKTTGMGVKALVEKCPHLRHLDLSKCTNIGDKAAAALALHSRNLEVLIIPQCKDLTLAGADAIVKGCAELKLLELPSCFNRRVHYTLQSGKCIYPENKFRNSLWDQEDSLLISLRWWLTYYGI